MDKFDPAQFIKIAADDISKLRKCDVFRLLDECGSDNIDAMVDYIRANRPDYADEVQQCLEEIADNT